MEILAILIGLLILAAVAFYVSRPLVQARRTPRLDGVDALTLEAQRDSLYTQIKELDLDHATGKVNEEDYTRIRSELVAEAAAVLRQIDGVTKSPAPQPLEQPAPVIAPIDEDKVEAMISARRKTRSAPAAKSTAAMARAADPAAKPADADVEAAIAARRKTAAPAELKCPQCGKPISAGDAFCAKCGTALQTQAAH